MKISGIHLRAISLLAFGSLAGAFAGIISHTVLARQLGPAGFGSFNSALATANILAPLAAFGVSGFWLRAFGKEGWGATRWIAPSLDFTRLTTALVIGLICVWAFIGPNDEMSRNLLLVVSLVTFGQVGTSLASSKLQLEERYSSLASLLAATNILRALFVLVAASFSWFLLSPISAAAGYAGISVALLAYSHFELRKMGGRLQLKGHPKGPKEPSESPSLFDVASGSWRYGADGLVFLIYYQIDIVLIRYIAGEAEAGLYSAAYLIVGATYLFPGVLFQKFLLPKLHRWAHHDRRKLGQVLKIGTASMLVIGIIVAALLAFVAPVFLPLVFGASFTQGVPLLLILCLCIPVKFASASAGAVLTSGAVLTNKLIIMISAAAFNVIANLLFIPNFGASGAAWVTLGTEVIVLLSFLCVGVAAMRKPSDDRGAP